MGLDTLELVMEMEQTFEIVIPDRDAERIQTVGEAYRYILEKLESEAPSPCVSAGVFYRLRRALGDSLSVDRERVRLSTPLEELVPPEGRPSSWHRLGDALGLGLPGLYPPPWLLASTIGLVSLLGLLFGAIAFAGSTPGFPIRSAIWSLLLTASLAVLALHTCGLHRTCLPPGCRSVRAMVTTISRTHYGRTESRRKRWDRDEVWPALRDLIAEQVGIQPDEVKEEHSFTYNYD